MKTEKILHVPYSEFTEMERIIEGQKKTIEKLDSGMPFIKVHVIDRYSRGCAGRVERYITNEEFQKEFGYIPERLYDIEKHVVEINDLKKSCLKLRLNVKDLENELEENSLLKHKTFGLPTVSLLMFASSVITGFIIDAFHNFELFKF